MADYGELSPCEIGRSCLLKPTQGSHQEEKCGVVIDETKTLLMVRVDGELSYWKFSKKNMLRKEADNNAPPNYELIFTR